MVIPNDTNRSEQLNMFSFQEENKIVTFIKEMLNPSFFNSAEITLQENKGTYNSIRIELKNNPYRNGFDTSFLLARIKTTGKTQYISFSSKIAKELYMFEDKFTSTKSEPDFLRLDIDEFLNYDDVEKLSKCFTKGFLTVFNFPSFGCCSRYQECSQLQQCIHPDLLYSTACMLRKNIEETKEFFELVTV